MNALVAKWMASWPFWLALGLGLVFTTFQILGFDLSMYPGDFGDGRFNNYILEHGHRFLTGQEPSLWNAPFMYPEPEVVTFSDNLIGTVPLYSIWRAFGCTIETSFQAWYILLTIFNFTACYFLLKFLFKNRYASALGAFIFAFSLTLQTQLTHAQTFPRFFIPLALLCLLIYHKSLHPKYLFAAFLMLVWQFYGGIYLGFMLSVPFTLLLFWILFNKRREVREFLRDKRWIIQSMLAVLINIGLLLVLMVPYYLRSLQFPGTPYHEVVGTLPTVRSYFCSKYGTLFWDKLTNVTVDYATFYDHQLFPGSVTLLSFFALVTLFLFFRKRVRLEPHMYLFWPLVGIGLMTMLLFFRYNRFTLYYFLYHAPGFSSMRALTRIINVELFVFALGIALVAYLLVRKWPKYSALIFIVLLSALTADNFLLKGESYTIRKQDVQIRTAALGKLMDDIPKGSIVSYEPLDDRVPMFFHQIDAMLTAQQLELKCINAYTGTSPSTFSPYWWQPSPETRKLWLDAVGAKPDTVYVISTSIGITPK